MAMATSFHSLYLLTLSLWLSSVFSKTLFVEVPPGGEECFYEEYQKDETIDFLFAIKRGGQHDIEVKIYSPYNTLYAQKLGDKYDRFKKDVDTAGVYKLCFNNAMSRWTSKIVGIELLGPHRPEIMHYNKLTKKRHLNSMERTVYNIGAKLDSISQLQTLSTDMEQMFEDTIRSASEITSYVTILELFVVLVVYIYQIKTIRSWFKK
eukprot:403796_1